jgi:hypothetical protein
LPASAGVQPAYADAEELQRDLLELRGLIVHDAFARFNSLSRQGRSDCDAAVGVRVVLGRRAS